jgi:hypothetical protein
MCTHEFPPAGSHVTHGDEDPDLSNPSPINAPIATLQSTRVTNEETGEVEFEVLITHQDGSTKTFTTTAEDIALSGDFLLLHGYTVSPGPGSTWEDEAAESIIFTAPEPEVVQA